MEIQAPVPSTELWVVTVERTMAGKGQSWLNQCASSHCTLVPPPHLLLDLFLLFHLHVTITIHVDCRRPIVVDTPSFLLRLFVLHVIRRRDDESAAAGAGQFSISCCSSSIFVRTLSLSGTKTGSMQLFGKNCGTEWRKRDFTLFH